MARKATAKSAPVQTAVSPPAEVIKVHASRIACDGVGGALGHPRVWLQIGESGSVDCLYCDRRFELSHGKGEHGGPGVYEASSAH